MFDLESLKNRIVNEIQPRQDLTSDESAVVLLPHLLQESHEFCG